MRLHHRVIPIVLTLLCLSISVCQARVVYVKTTGDDASDGLSWNTAKKTVQAGINASVGGDEIWVAAGVYVERITLKADTELYGGFAGTESSRDQRNWRTNATVLDGNKTGSVVTAPSGATLATVIDGFTIQNGSVYGGVYCAYSSPMVSNNTITSSQPCGIYCANSSPSVTGNIVSGNDGYGLYGSNNSSPVIAHNVISANRGSGVYWYSSSSPVMVGNIIAGNSGNGIDCSSCTPAITNNTISGNSGDGIYCSYTPAEVSSNIIAFNVSGIRKYQYCSEQPVLRNNCVYGNISYNYSGVSIGAGDISADPHFASERLGDYHIQPDSPCRDAGHVGAREVPTTDMDGQTRIQGSTVDIGADETDGTLWDVAPVVIRVSPDGNDANDGSSWGLAKKTVQAGVLAASLGGGEVWVRAGTYDGQVALLPHASMYGGFAGTESARDERDWSVNPTIIDGGVSGRNTVDIRFCLQTGTVDGFTIRNGSYGVFCASYSSPTIANNTITRVASAGIYCSYGSQLITNNIISGCSGGGITCSNSSSATITNNTVSGNGNTGIYIDRSSAAVSNNIVAFNSAGISVSTVSGTLALRNNCIYGNPGYDYSGIPAGIGDISADPRFASREYGNYHIQPDSPCRDAGDGGAPGLLAVDVDGQSRAQGNAVDIGADESHGTVWNVQPVIVRVSPDGNDANDGSSWALAKKTIQAGANAASAVGGEVWVKAGTYNERVTMAQFASLYGGFAGTESSVEERNWWANPTIVDGGSMGDVITVKSGVQAITIDGFTVRNGTNGINCSSGSSPVISHNAITGNGYGVYCSSPSAPTITNNLITVNRIDGIYCYTSSSPTIANNTITGSSGVGIKCVSSAGTISNNIVAFNASGIGGSGTPVLRSNCVYGNLTYNYSGITAGAGDISVDPKLAAVQNANLHIQPDSPCRDAGEDSVVGEGWVDIDGQARVQGGHVDIGSDESDGTAWPEPTTTVVRVSPDGDDANDGSSWALAKKTVQAGVNAASAAGGEVWVKAGAYYECTTLRPYAPLYGGFAGTESSREARDWRANSTIIDGKGQGSVVSISFKMPTAVVDGLVIRNGTIGIYCTDGTSPVITNNRITGSNDGIICKYGAPVIASNTIRGNKSSGIDCSYSTAASVINNVIAGNGSYGVNCYSSTSVAITNNTISGNGSGGIAGLYSKATISNNIVAFNTRGVCSGSTSVLRNNCVYGNPGSDYSEVSAGTGDISADPLLVSKELGECHIRPDSPCRNAGYTSALGIPTTDMDGQARVQDTAVDIGADESDGASWPVPAPVIIRVSPDGDDTNDGSSWTLAKRSLQAGVNAASAAGGEVWVKAGTYGGSTTLLPYTSMYGGFAGVESSRAGRNWNANPTIIGVGGSGALVTLSLSASATVLDGFTIQRGSPGISCSSWASPTIANNVIAMNTGYGAISCDTAASPLIQNNIIKGNKNGAILCYSGSPIITNNTITGNAGAAISLGVSSSASVSNNIIAFNEYGISRNGTTGTPVLRNNCVFGNANYNYSSISAGIGDVSVDPLLVSKELGECHIQPNSPCRDAGYSGAQGIPATDMDGQSRVQGSAVDIGADESDGSVPTVPAPAIAYVTPEGNDCNDGLSWARAKRSIASAQNALPLSGGEIWVKAGTYGRTTMQAYVSAYGGFAGTESSRSERDWVVNRTIIDCAKCGDAFTVQSNAQTVAIDGFIIRNCNNGVTCTSSSPTITNNVITANANCGISCSSASPVIVNNVISANTKDGVACTNSSSPAITNNTITGNLANAINCSGSTPAISNNIIAFNASGVLTSGTGTPVLRNNCVNGNTAFNYSATTPGQGDIAVDPCFIGETPDDYRIPLESPCTNAGWNLARGLPATDLAGRNRIFGEIVDIGAYEASDDLPPAVATPTFSPTNNGLVYPASVMIRCATDGAVIRYTTNGKAPQITDPVAGSTIALAGPCTLKAKAWKPGMTPSLVASMTYVAGDNSVAPAKAKAQNAPCWTERTVVTYVMNSNFFYIESDDRSSGIMVYKVGHGMQAGMRTKITGGLWLSGSEKCIKATNVTQSGIGTIEPLTLRNKDIGGAAWQYSAIDGKGQVGVKEYRMVKSGDTWTPALFDADGMNNIGLLISTTGRVTNVSAPYIYIDDGSNLRDGMNINAGHTGVRVLAGTLIPSGADLMGKHVKVMGISSCYVMGYGDVYRLVRASALEIIE